jgi:hypothetical protein
LYVGNNMMGCIYSNLCQVIKLSWFARFYGYAGISICGTVMGVVAYKLWSCAIIITLLYFFLTDLPLGMSLYVFAFQL